MKYVEKHFLNLVEQFIKKMKKKTVRNYQLICISNDTNLTNH